VTTKMGASLRPVTEALAALTSPKMSESSSPETRSTA
jgi:hypothetical protein